MRDVETKGADVIKEFERRLVAPIREGRPFVTEGLEPDYLDWDNAATWEDECPDRYYQFAEFPWMMGVDGAPARIDARSGWMENIISADLKMEALSFILRLIDTGDYRQTPATDQEHERLSVHHKLESASRFPHAHTVKITLRRGFEFAGEETDPGGWQLSVVTGSQHAEAA